MDKIEQLYVKRHNMKYWLCVTNEENWQIIKEKRIWGVPERRKAIIDQVKPGDLLVFYVKPKRIGGIFEATSESFLSETEIFKGGLFPHRIKLKAIFIPKEPKSFEPLIRKLTFIKNKKFWTISLRRAVLEISKDDYEVIRKGGS